MADGKGKNVFMTYTAGKPVHSLHTRRTSTDHEKDHEDDRKWAQAVLSRGRGASSVAGNHRLGVGKARKETGGVWGMAPRRGCGSVGTLPRGLGTPQVSTSLPETRAGTWPPRGLCRARLGLPALAALGWRVSRCHQPGPACDVAGMGDHGAHRHTVSRRIRWWRF